MKSLRISLLSLILLILFCKNVNDPPNLPEYRKIKFEYVQTPDNPAIYFELWIGFGDSASIDLEYSKMVDADSLLNLYPDQTVIIDSILYDPGFDFVEVCVYAVSVDSQKAGNCIIKELE